MDPNSNTNVGTNADNNSNFSQEATNNPPPSNEPTPQSYRYEEGRANSKIVISEDEMEYLRNRTSKTSISVVCRFYHKKDDEHPNPWLFLNKIYEVIEDKEIDFSCLEEDPEVVITKKKTKYAMLLNERRKAESAFEETGDILGFLGSVCKTSEGVRKRLLQQFRREKKRLKKDKGKDSNDSISAEVEPIQANLCSVCGDEIEKAYFLFPCGDSSFCKPCAKELHDNNKKCPIDGSEILGIAPKK